MLFCWEDVREIDDICVCEAVDDSSNPNKLAVSISTSQRLVEVILLVDEILHQPTCMTTCREWDIYILYLHIYHINWLISLISEPTVCLAERVDGLRGHFFDSQNACCDLLFLLNTLKTVVNSKQPGPNISHQTPGKTPFQEFFGLTINHIKNLRLWTRPVWKTSSWVFLPPKKSSRKGRYQPASSTKEKDRFLDNVLSEAKRARFRVQKNLLDVWGKPKPWELLKDDIIQSSCKLGRWA